MTRLCCGSPVIRWSWKYISPLSGARLPQICAISVVLPAPLGPISACTSPAATSSDTLSVATRPPKRLARFSSLSIVLPSHLPGEQAGDALRGEQHDGEQHRADREVAVLLVVGHQPLDPGHRMVGDQMLEAEQRHCADGAAPEAADAAE